MSHITEASKMSRSVDVISPHCASEHNKGGNIWRDRPTKPEPNPDRSRRENYQLQIKQLIYFLLSQGEELWWAGCTAVFSRSVIRWWKASILKPLCTLSCWPAAEWAGVLPLEAGYRAEPPTRRTSNKRPFSPCDMIAPPPSHSSSNSSGSISACVPPRLVKSGFFTSRWPKGFNWFTRDSLTPAAQVHVRQCQQGGQKTAGPSPCATSRRPLAVLELFEGPTRQTLWISSMLFRNSVLTS